MSNITYINTAEGWLYLASILDLYSRRVVGWAMADKMDVSLVESAWQMAITSRRPSTGLVHHSDRGSQYTSNTSKPPEGFAVQDQYEPNRQLL